jgi:hypothetical protein
MSTFIHTPEGLHSFHISHTECASSVEPHSILLKRVVSDLYKWLDCTWAAALVPSRPGASLVPELRIVSVEGSGWNNQSPDLICPVRNHRTTGLAAIVVIGPRKDGAPYSEQDRLFADALCCHVSTLQDLDSPRDIYDRLDHCGATHLPGLEYRGQCLRAETIGGDFFDVEPRPNGELFIAIGTVAARGISGGIVLGGALASLRSLARPGSSLLGMAVEMNRTLWELSPENSFTSFLCAEINPSRKCLSYVNAGHEPALLLRQSADRVDRLDPTGAVLGLSRRNSFRELTIPFEPGDILAAFTDGIAESVGPREVVRILREESGSPVSDLTTNLLDASTASTDRTLILVRSSIPQTAYARAAA